MQDALLSKIRPLTMSPVRIVTMSALLLFLGVALLLTYFHEIIALIAWIVSPMVVSVMSYNEKDYEKFLEDDEQPS